MRQGLNLLSVTSKTEALVLTKPFPFPDEKFEFSPLAQISVSVVKEIKLGVSSYRFYIIVATGDKLTTHVAEYFLNYDVAN